MKNCLQLSSPGFLRLALGLAAMLPFDARGQDPAPAADPVTSLRAEFDRVRAELDKPVSEFHAQYELQLKKLESKAAAAGNLDLVLAVQREAKGLAASNPPDAFPELKRLRAIYDKKMIQLGGERNQKLKKLLGSYRKLLLEKQHALTRARKIDQAVAVKAEVTKIETELREINRQIAEAAPPRVLPGSTSPASAVGELVGFGTWSNGQPINLPEDRRGYTAAFGGSDHVVAIKRDGEAVTFGRAERFLLKKKLKDVKTVACGRHLNLALHGDGEVTAWGNHEEYVRDTVKDLENVTAVSVGHSLNAVLFRDGTANVFGYAISHDGQRFPRPEWLTGIERLAVGQKWVYLVKQDGTFQGVGLDGNEAQPPNEHRGKISALGAGTSLAALLMTDRGKAVGWRMALPEFVTDAKIQQIRSNGGMYAIQLKDGSWRIWGHAGIGERLDTAVQAMGPLKDLGLSTMYQGGHGFFVGIK